MKHVRAVSRKPELAINIGGGTGNMSLLEQAIILVLSLTFSDWQNFQQVLTNLEKFYSKTPEV